MNDLLQLLLVGGVVIAGFGLGYAAGRRAKPEFLNAWPLCQVSFGPDSSDEDRLRFLEEAAQAVRDGRLSKAKHFQDHGATNQSAKPRGELED